MTTPSRQAARPPATTLVGTLALLAALVLPLAHAPRAEAFVYWTDGITGTIGRANLDGTGIDERFITGGDRGYAGVAVDAAHVYWTDPSAATIGRANLDGSGVDHSFISGFPARPEGVAVDAGHIYWTNSSTYTIGRANLDGTGVEPSFISGASYPWALAVDAAHVYWGNFGTRTIGRANLDGTGVEPSFISGVAQLEALAVDASHIYWTNSNYYNPSSSSSAATVGRASLDGTGVDQSFIEPFHPWAGLAVDAAHVYWTNGSTIGRANLDGSGVKNTFITAYIPFAIAVNFSVGKLKKDKKRGTARLTVEVPAPGTVALAETTKVRGAEVRAEVAGEVQLAIKPQGRAKKKLGQKGKSRVNVEVTYTPDGGQPEMQTARLKLIKRG